jgi:hypothetical protein
MTIPTEPTAADTVADLVEYWTGVRENGPLAPATTSAYLGAIARILHSQGVSATTVLDTLDLPALTASFTAAHPDLQPSTLASVTTHLRAAINGYTTRHRPGLTVPSTSPFTPPAPEPGPSGPPEPAHEQSAPRDLDGTLAHLDRFADQAGRSGLLKPRTAQLYAETARRILTDQPHLAELLAVNADPQTIMKEFAERHPNLAPGTLAAYGTRLSRVIAAYTAYLADPQAIAQPAPSRGPRPAFGRTTEVPLPGGRVVSLRTPPDLTDQEAAATGALLRLYHPRMFTPDHPATEPHEIAEGTWTLVFWPEHAPDEPEAAHLIGDTFRRALADFIRTRHPDYADHSDGEAIDDWYSTEVFVALAFDGHHHAHDSGTLL